LSPEKPPKNDRQTTAAEAVEEKQAAARAKRKEFQKAKEWKG
jgi:hypothetical protein